MIEKLKQNYRRRLIQLKSSRQNERQRNLMKRTVSNVSMSVLLLVLVGPLQATDFHVYYLGGQSNMDGYGVVKELPSDLQGGVPDVWIFHGNMGIDGTPADGRGKWTQLKAGHGRNFSSDGNANKYSDRFGVELTFARRLKEIYPDRNIALIKYSRGGTSISADASAAKRFGCWAPDWKDGDGKGQGINQYDHFLATMDHARADTDIDDDGTKDRLIPSGILWMQGESDAQSKEVAEEYETNLTELMGLIREALGGEKVRVVIGRITDWKVWTFGETVREAQASFVKKDKNAALVTTTDNYKNSDPWHYDTAGYIDLGKQFANAVASDDAAKKSQ